MINLLNFHLHLSVQEVKILLAVIAHDAEITAETTVDGVVRAVIGVVLNLLLLAAVLSFLSGVILVIVALESDSESIRLLYNKLLLGGILGIPTTLGLRRLLFGRPPEEEQ